MNKLSTIGRDLSMKIAVERPRGGRPATLDFKFDHCSR